MKTVSKFLAAGVIAVLSVFGSVATPSSAQDAWTAPVTDGHYFTMNADNQPPVNVQMYGWVEWATIKPHYNTSPFDTRNGATLNKQVAQNVQTVLPVCASTSATMCISKVEYSVGGEWLTPKPLTSPGQPFYAYGGRTDYVHTALYEANPKNGMIAGSLPNLWDLPGAEHSLGSNYWINAVTHGVVGSDGKVRIEGIDFDAWGTRISPAAKQLDCWAYYVGTEENGGGFCNELVSMPANLKLRISVKMGSRIGELKGWFDGRIANPDIDFGSKTPGVITVEGSPIVVPTMVSKPTATKTCPNTTTGCWGAFNVRKDGMWGFREHEKIIAERSIADNTYFRLSSWVDGNSKSSSCFTSKGVIGVILTNASTYSPDAPAWNRSAQSLSFEVASPHSSVDGKANSGFYSLLVAEKVAKCLWGKNINKGSATLTVTSNNGEPQTAVTSFGVSKGWAKFNASGFHYSAPKITVKLKGTK